MHNCLVNITVLIQEGLPEPGLAGGRNVADITDRISEGVEEGQQLGAIK